MLQRKDGTKATAKKHDKIPRKFSGYFISLLSIINKTHVELSYLDTKALMTHFTGHWKQRLVLGKTFSRNLLQRDHIYVQVCKNGQTLTIIQRIASKFYFTLKKCLFLGYMFHPLIISAFNALWNVLWMPQYQNKIVQYVLCWLTRRRWILTSFFQDFSIRLALLVVDYQCNSCWVPYQCKIWHFLEDFACFWPIQATCVVQWSSLSSRNPLLSPKPYLGLFNENRVVKYPYKSKTFKIQLIKPS